MKEITATDAARGFSEVLDAVERRHESFLVRRGGKVVAKIGPASESCGALAKALIRDARLDRAWTRDLAELRSGLRTDERAWPD